MIARTDAKNAIHRTHGASNASSESASDNSANGTSGTITTIRSLRCAARHAVKHALGVRDRRDRKDGERGGREHQAPLRCRKHEQGCGLHLRNLLLGRIWLLHNCSLAKKLRQVREICRWRHPASSTLRTVRG
jgi:hypothetical protein